MSEKTQTELAAAIERLRYRLENYPGGFGDETTQEIETIIAAAESQLERDEADTKRLDWLEEGFESVSDMDWLEQHTKGHKTLREAIDAARRGEKEEAHRTIGRLGRK